jgi:hypothetical protein
LKEPLKAAFSLTDEEADTMSYTDMYDYCDVLISEDFEGVPPRYDFTEEEWLNVLSTPKWALINTFPGDVRTIMDTKLMRYPLQVMSNRVSKIIAGTDSDSDLKFIIYSAHDY